ncbi:hypothetical protein N7493_004041 [Penicillium malachiteum]|uniref:Uncharacterized protein n=1 Tax=Penicillium malachiteum TaxID=1324776 RepID=A0AAD6MY46_9EURO|nr:hypothetical protein N7493_004041 [Penicillium malachiteum]
MVVSAPDVITYIGIPLAVLGVLPIIYTSFRALWTERLIRSALKRYDLFDSAVTRVSLMGGIVEVELPRCTISPLDRELDASYWKLNDFQVSLKGGSWSIFHWNRLVTGKVLYRCQFKDELTIPQADIEFEDLVAFLLDRGAVPDPQGWRMLKTTGLWTPPGTALLRPPRGIPGIALTVMSPDDSDGVLSLHVQWKTQWDSRNSASMPPFWMRLERPGLIKDDHRRIVDKSGMEITKDTSSETASEQMKTFSRQTTATALDSTDKTSSYSLLTKINETESTSSSNVSIRFKIEQEHVERVFFEHDNIMTGEYQDLSKLDETFGLWFACTACALSQNGDFGLWNFAIPDHIASFARQKSIPCGVMVILGILSEENVPPWASPPPQLNQSPAEIQQRLYEETLARRMENAMPPDQAAQARNNRVMMESNRFHNDNLKRIEAQEEYKQRRLIEAIQSPRLDNKVIAEASLTYLVSQEIVPANYTMPKLAQAVLYLMILDMDQAKIIADILERWMLWCQFGGMQKPQLTLLMENKIAFSYASALVAVVQQANAGDGNLSSDMLDCLRLWNRVRVG